jgi:hydroxyethylthiazole kinase-like uncharacterized protein yjeF
VQAWVCGSGLSTDRKAREELRAVLASPVPAVLDADAITMLVDGTLGPALRARDAPTILTPHDGEFARLAGEQPGLDRIASARALAAQTASVVLLKGPTTTVAHPDGRVRLVTAGDARLATAGTGDVLSGCIGALLARGLDPLDAAASGAYLHATAATLGPPEGLIATDLVHALPLALTHIRASTTDAPARPGAVPSLPDASRA